MGLGSFGDLVGFGDLAGLGWRFGWAGDLFGLQIWLCWIRHFVGLGN